MKYPANVLCGMLLTLTCFLCNAQTSTSLTPGEFEKNISGTDSIQILDVRTPAEYSAGHIKNSLLADWTNKDEFNRRISFMDKDKPVYVYCFSGGRSGAAAKEMRSMGYKVYELNGGISAWKVANKPLEINVPGEQMSLRQFDSAINSAPLVLVDFGAEWCGPCKKMAPVVKKLQLDNAGKFALLKVDTDKADDIIKHYAVNTLPVLIVFKNGKQVWRKNSVAEEKELAAAMF